MRLTNPLWYLAGFLIALGSVMAATVVAAGAYDPIRESTITPTRQRVDAQDKTLAVFTDLVQSDRTIRCTATSRDKKTVLTIPRSTIDITVDEQGNRWHMIALLRDGRPDLKVRCAPTDRRVDNATYGYAAVTGYSDRVNDGKGIAVLGAAVGAILAAYVWWCRRDRRRWATIEAMSDDAA